MGILFKSLSPAQRDEEAPYIKAMMSFCDRYAATIPNLYAYFCCADLFTPVLLCTSKMQRYIDAGISIPQRCRELATDLGLMATNDHLNALGCILALAEARYKDDLKTQALRSSSTATLAALNYPLDITSTDDRHKYTAKYIWNTMWKAAYPYQQTVELRYRFCDKVVVNWYKGIAMNETITEYIDFEKNLNAQSKGVDDEKIAEGIHQEIVVRSLDVGEKIEGTIGLHKIIDNNLLYHLTAIGAFPDSSGMLTISRSDADTAVATIKEKVSYYSLDNIAKLDEWQRGFADIIARNPEKKTIRELLMYSVRDDAKCWKAISKKRKMNHTDRFWKERGKGGKGKGDQYGKGGRFGGRGGTYKSGDKTGEANKPLCQDYANGVRPCRNFQNNGKCGLRHWLHEGEHPTSQGDQAGQVAQPGKGKGAGAAIAHGQYPIVVHSTGVA
jgi:hypothetical protein